MSEANQNMAAFLAAMANGVPLGRLPAHHAARDPRGPAVTVAGQTLTREGLEAAANRRARQLALEGVVQGDFVSLSLPNSMEFYETTFAIWKLGATPNIVSPKLPDIELGEIVKLVDPRVVVGPDPARLPGRRVRAAGAPIDESLSADPLPDVVSTYWKATTSGGSTGRPKIIVDHMPGMWSPTMTVLSQAVDDVVLNPGPLYHNAPFIATHYALFTGGHIVDMVKFDALQALELIDLHGVTWVNMVPTMMHRIWRLPPEQRAQFSLASLRVLYHMASMCPVWLKQAFIDWLGPDRIIELYGGAERQGTTIITGREWLTHKGSVGKPQPGSTIRVLDENGADCPPNQIGEIHFLPDAGLNSSYHYIGAEAQTLGDWDSLGDLGWFDDDGYLYLADRRADLIIVGGANVYPAEVEAAIDAHPEVASSVVIGLPDEDLGERIHAIVQRREGSHLTADALLAATALRIAKSKTPRTVEFTEDPLRDDAGKVRRSALRQERLATTVAS